MPFTQQTIDFLFENRLHDSKPWFLEHKQDYERFVKQPFIEFVNALAPTMAKIDPLIITDPKKLSRIYCDARYAKESVFRDEVWYTFARARENAYDGHPGFWFAISPGGISFGCGYYCADGRIKEAIRSMIISDDPAFTAAFAAVSGQKVFTQYGGLYKKNRFPDQPPEKCDWLNRKDYGVMFRSNSPRTMFSEGLARRVARDFLTIAPLYGFFLRAEQLAFEKEQEGIGSD